MAYYVERREHFGGTLVLFQRDLAVAVPNAKRHRKQNWYMRLKIGGRKGYVTRSTKLTSYEDAYEFAKSELLRLQQAARLGHSLDEYTFDQHWNDWYDRNVKNDAWRADRTLWHKRYADRYFKAYFKHADGTSMVLNEITPQVVKGYWDWRITYWQREEGQKIQRFNPKRRNAKSSTTNNAKANPAAKTLLMEQSALNQIFFDAAELGRLQQTVKFRAPVQNRTPNRRAGFDGDEYDALTRYLRSYRDCVGVFGEEKLNAWHKLQRQQLYHFIIFLANSGLRVGEAREMRWQDVNLDVAVDGSKASIADIAVRKATKTGRVRHVQTQPTGNKTLKEWMEKSPHPAPDDYVWFGQSKDETGKSQPFNDLNKGFQNFLKRVPYAEREDGLLYDKDGDKRSLYSLRHSYATMRLEKGDVGIYDLALNMGCGVKQIEQHYSHVMSKQRRHEITKFKPILQKSVAPSSNPVLAAALEQFQLGKLDAEKMKAIIDLVAQTDGESTSG